ncbi:hypothetical protein HYU22_02855 [Candidatus Woesearchaeota archaeon]|nr:hypothetical protein [Candidatus Woesearchaeota archaeon]
MKIQIQKEVFAKFPKLRIAFILVSPIKSTAKFPESLHLLREAEGMVHLTFHKNNFQSHDLISSWAVARQEFGKEAQHYHTSVERLLQRVLARKRITGNTTLTNIVRYLSLKHLVPMSVDDPSKMVGALTFAISGREKKGWFRRLAKGSLYYHDMFNIVGTKFDHWKNPKVALGAMSTSALIHIDALPPVSTAKLKSIVQETQQLVRSFCGGKSTVVILDRKKKVAVI